MKLQNSVVYQVFVRDFSFEGTLSGLNERIDDLARMGINIIQLLPIHPIGLLNRKGSLGSPYSISDYEKIDENIGSFADLRTLLDHAHNQNIQIIMDVVFNHTSRDSRLLKEHPEWFYRNENGSFANKIGDWSDVYDLDHEKAGLDDYITDVLLTYLRLGVDGFRFDVATFLPASFYQLLRAKCKANNLYPLLIGEAIDTTFLLEAREQNFLALSNQELIESGLDMLYPYASFENLRLFLATHKTEDLYQYQATFNLEQASISESAFIYRAIENHDYPRIASYSKDENFIRSLMAFNAFCKGPFFLYNGGECKATHKPSLFEKEVIDFTILDKDYYQFVLKLIQLKKRKKNEGHLVSRLLPVFDKALVLLNTYKDHSYELGLFNLSEDKIVLHLPKDYDGTYLDLLSERRVTIEKGELLLTSPLLLEKIA